MKLLVDAMCGKLATYLRMCGHDTAYALDRDVEGDDALLALARTEDRTLVTRAAGLAERSGDAIHLEGAGLTDRLGELSAAGVPLSLPPAPTRCGRCNGSLRRVAADADTPGYAPDARETAVWRCPGCDQHFWRGSHWADVRETLQDL